MGSASFGNRVFRVAAVRIALGGITGLAGAACVAPGPPVTVLNRPPKERSCELLGRVEGKGTSSAKARNGLRKEARVLGADTVVIDAPLELEPARRVLLKGQALRCVASQPSESTPAQAEVEGAGAAPQVEETPGGAPTADGTPGGAPQAAETQGAAPPAEEAPGGAPQAEVEETQAPPAEPSLEERLRTLQKLHDEGLITDEEYAERKQELLQEL